MNSDYIQLLRGVGAIQKGSFVLSSGKISDTYIQLFRLLDHPSELEKITERLAEFIGNHKCDVLLAPAMGGVVIGYLVSKYLRLRGNEGHRFTFCERVNGKFELRRGFQINKGDKVWVVENLVTTGKSAREAIDVADCLGGHTLGVVAVVDRGGGESLEADGYIFHSLVRVYTKEYEPADAPQALLDMGPIKPGGRL